jgi:hypothetical protein
MGQCSVTVWNAGLVLAHPFLPRLFAQLEMTTNSNGGITWTDPSCAIRAVRLLQWLVDDLDAFPNTDLSLCNVICGLPVDVPLEPQSELTLRERDMISNLLIAMLGKWSAVSQSSPAAIRESFFQRQGDLLQTNDNWRLQVQREPSDILLDELPWAIAVVRFPWMPLPLSVSW